MYEIMANSVRFSMWSDNPMSMAPLKYVKPYLNNHGYVLAVNNPSAVTPKVFFDDNYQTAKDNWLFWKNSANIL